MTKSCVGSATLEAQTVDRQGSFATKVKGGVPCLLIVDGEPEVICKRGIYPEIEPKGSQLQPMLVY